VPVSIRWAGSGWSIGAENVDLLAQGFGLGGLGEGGVGLQSRLSQIVERVDDLDSMRPSRVVDRGQASLTTQGLHLHEPKRHGGDFLRYSIV
jgi:hypothetical protein